MSAQSAERTAAEAMAAHRAGQFDRAEELCRQILETSPNSLPSLVHLAVLTRNRGAFEESISLALRAVEIDRRAADGYIQLGLGLLATGQSAEAVGAFMAAISRAPQVAPVHHHLGMALENLGRTEEAKRAFLEATRLAPGDVRARLSLGSLLLTQEDVAGAKAHAETAIRADPRSGEAHLLQAKILVAERRGAEAEASIRRALEIEPHSSFGRLMLGFRLLQRGDFGRAEEEFRRSIALDPAQGLSFWGITQARKITEADRPLVQDMERTAAGVPLTLEQAGYLHFGLANCYDNLGEYEKAMAHYDEAHRNASRFRYGDQGFVRADYASDFEKIRKLYPPELFAKAARGFESELPIFIVGMMRSGTTLTEQILSSHPQVGASGENEFWARRGREAENHAASRFDLAQATTLARQYCREMRSIAPGHPRVTDKLPGNYQRLGEIHLAMPNAKIVHCRRSPVDTALSIYFTANPVAPAYTHTKEGIAFAYRQYKELMEHWRKLLPPDRFYEVRYEDLVRSPREEIALMLDFLDLPWDEACLRHERNAKEVRTPSLWQVRQPMYATSIQRWRKYEPWLGAFRELIPASDLP